MIIHKQEKGKLHDNSHIDKRSFVYKNDNGFWFAFEEFSKKDIIILKYKRHFHVQIL